MRNKIYERDNYIYIFYKKVDRRLEVDHTKSLSLFPELRFDLSNDRTLCMEYRIRTDTYGGKIVSYKKRIMI